MKSKFKMQDEEAAWYENYEPVKAYLDSAFPQKSIVPEKNPKTVRFPWLEIMRKSFRVK